MYQEMCHFLHLVDPSEAERELCLLPTEAPLQVQIHPQVVFSIQKVARLNIEGPQELSQPLQMRNLRRLLCQ